MNNYDFSIGNNGLPLLSLLANGLSFNHLCIIALGEPEYISIGLDRETKTLAIKAAENTDDKSFCRYRFVSDEKKKKRVTVSASKLRAEIIRLIENSPSRKGIKFTAHFDDNTKMLIVDLKQTINF